MTVLPIAKLSPSLQDSKDHAIRAVVTLLWPYSSSRRSLSLLLAEPDFRLRHSKGQVKVTFHGLAAEAVARSKIGIGDTVVLGLGDVSWTSHDAETGTPGKGLDWDLEFQSSLRLEINRNSAYYDTVIFDAPSPAPPEESNGKATPSSASRTPPFNLDEPEIASAPSTTWSSPAFSRHTRASFGSLPASPFDPFAEEDGYVPGKGRKRPRFSGLGREWKLDDTPASPTKDNGTWDADEDLDLYDESSRGSVVSEKNENDDQVESSDVPNGEPGTKDQTPFGYGNQLEQLRGVDVEGLKGQITSALHEPSEELRQPTADESNLCQVQEDNYPKSEMNDTSEGMEKRDLSPKKADLSEGYRLRPSEYMVSGVQADRVGASSAFQVDGSPTTTYRSSSLENGQTRRTASVNNIGDLAKRWTEPREEDRISGLPYEVRSENRSLDRDREDAKWYENSVQESEGVDVESEEDIGLKKVEAGAEDDGIDGLEEVEDEEEERESEESEEELTDTGSYVSSDEEEEVGVEEVNYSDLVDGIRPGSAGGDAPERAAHPDVIVLSSDDESDEQLPISKSRVQSSEDEVDLEVETGVMTATEEVNSDEESEMGSDESDHESEIVDEYPLGNDPDESVQSEIGGEEVTGMDAEELISTPEVDADTADGQVDIEQHLEAKTLIREGSLESIVDSIQHNDISQIEKISDTEDVTTTIEVAADVQEQPAFVPEGTADSQHSGTIYSAAHTLLFGNSSGQTLHRDEPTFEEGSSHFGCFQLPTPDATQESFTSPGQSSRYIPMDISLDNSMLKEEEPGIDTYADSQIMHEGDHGRASPGRLADKIDPNYTPHDEEIPTPIAAVPSDPNPILAQHRDLDDKDVRGEDMRQDGELGVEHDEVVLVDDSPRKDSLAPSKMSFPEPNRLATGLRTHLSYFAPLSTLPDFFNTLLDTISVAVSGSEPVRATSGPRDYHVSLNLTDPSLAGTTATAQIFRRHKRSLPTIAEGSLVLLRNFKVESFHRHMILISCESSAWAVFPPAEASHGDYTEGKVEGAPVEFGPEERAYVSRLREWYLEEGAALVAARKALSLTSSPATPTPAILGRESMETVDSSESGGGTILEDGRRIKKPKRIGRRSTGRRITIHELRDGRRYTEVGSPGGPDAIHELRDGTVYTNF